jgi:predicted flap endonuclease-1-like 5' DNA nuclease
MLYLALEHAWWLVAALAIGLVIGAISPAAGGKGAGRAADVAGLLWAATAAAVWTRTLNGEIALLVETALLYTAVYALGCLLGSLFAGGPGPALAVAGGAGPVAAGGASGGRRPPTLAAARGAGPDDLKRLSGVAEGNELLLNRLGIWHFDQIAAWDADEIAWVGEYLAFPGRIEREDWVGQARILAAGGETEHSRALRGR